MCPTINYMPCSARRGCSKVAKRGVSDEVARGYE